MAGIKNGGNMTSIKMVVNTTEANNYNVYVMTPGEKAKYAIIAAIVLAAGSYVLFHNITISIIMSTFSLLYPGIARGKLVRKQKNMLSLQFKDALYCISSSLSAGRSVEGAFKAASSDLKVLYADENSFIIKELELINRRLEMNEVIDSILYDFAERSGIDDIKSFSEVFGICRQTGGNLIEVIKNTTSVINTKIEIQNEIEILVAEQKLSQKILNLMPFGLLLLIMTSSPDYIKPLYSPKGNAVMIVVLVLLAVSYYIGSKIVDIKV